MKKYLLIFILLSLFICSSFGVRPTEKEDEILYLKRLGMTNAQIAQVNKIESDYRKNLNNTLEKSRAYREKNPGAGQNAHNKFAEKLINKAYKDYTKELDKVLNSNQKKKYLEHRTSVY